MNQAAYYLQGSRDRHLGKVFFRRVQELGNKPFIKLQRGECFEEVSWRDFGTRVRGAIIGLYSLGLRKGDRVGIIGKNSLEWLCADMATLAGGLPNVIISPILSNTMLLRILAHSGCRAVFADNETTGGRLLSLKDQLPSLSTVIVMDGTRSDLPNTLTFAELISREHDQHDGWLQELFESIHADDLATIMYTSGSTGEAKGVMRTQGNLLSNITNGREIVLSKPDEISVLILSLNHLFGRFGFLKSGVTGRTTAVIEEIEGAVNLKVIESLSPTAMALVPRVMDKIWETILDQGNNRQEWEQVESLDRTNREQRSLSDNEENRFKELRCKLRDAVKRALGGRIKYISYGGAPMRPRIMRFFELIDIPLLGSYGTTECGGVTLSGVGETKPGSLGKPFPNVELGIAKDGEILVRGPTVTPGYFENPEATREVIDPNGWFHTGDLGTIDSDGCLFVVGRKKDVFNCSDGSNIYPGHIELLLENDPFISQAILLGDQRAFIAALILPDRARVGKELRTAESGLTDREVETVIRSRVEELNARLEEYEKIRKFILMKADFPADVRSVTVFQKIKIDRKAVEKLYDKEISQIYSQPLGGATA